MRFPANCSIEERERFSFILGAPSHKLFGVLLDGLHKENEMRDSVVEQLQQDKDALTGEVETLTTQLAKLQAVLDTVDKARKTVVRSAEVQLALDYNLCDLHIDMTDYR